MHRAEWVPGCIVSGGMSGVDRGALDAAIQMGIQHGGWVPPGGLMDDGLLGPRYFCRVAETPDRVALIHRNLEDSDATLILVGNGRDDRMNLVNAMARYMGREVFTQSVGGSDPAVIRRWVRDHAPRILHVTGSSEVECPGIAEQARQLLVEVLSHDPQQTESCGQCGGTGELAGGMLGCGACARRRTSTSGA